MENTVFLPKTIKVGFQKRSNTYTKKLAYIIYYDQAGKLRKEKSWKSWRDSKIPVEDFDNEPTEGFVLNKGVGGQRESWGWNARNEYIRVYDPRGFEFEISVSNLLHILENTSSIKGKGLEGEFVYGWEGTELILIPTLFPGYLDIIKFSDMLENPESIKAKDLVLGGTYRTNKNKDWIYLGRFIKYNSCNWNSNYGEPQGKQHFFWNNSRFETLKSISKRIVKTVSIEPAVDYAKLMDKVQRSDLYSPYDKSKDKYTLYSIGKLKNIAYSNSVYIPYDKYMVRFTLRNYSSYQIDSYYCNNDTIPISIKNSIEKKFNDSKITDPREIQEKFKLYKLNKYLKNGKLMKEA